MLTRVPCVALLAVCTACGGSLSSYDRNPLGPGAADTALLDTAAGPSGTTSSGSGTTTPTGTTGTGSTTGSSTTGTTTGASNTSTTTGASTGTPTGSGPPTGYTSTNPVTQTTAFSAPPGPLVDGVYEGWLYIEYYRDLGGPLLPPGPKSSTCNGEVRLVVDTTAGSPTITGDLIDCDWPLWDLWALINLGSIDGTIEGDGTSYGSATGDVSGDDGILISFSDSWTGYVLQGPTIAGEWHYTAFAVDEIDAWFVADWVSATP